jgi:serine/threonine-protein kinase RsbW
MILRTTAELGNLEEIRRFVEESARALQLDQKTAFDLVQAVDECATNIIEHGYRGRSGSIEIEIKWAEATLTIELRDRAPLFDPTGVPPPDLSGPLEARQPGGLGIYLTRRMVDDMQHRASPDGGNELILIKHVTTTTSSS